MKYTQEITSRLLLDYDGGRGKSAKELAEQLEVPERSVIAKLSSLGVYQRKQYVNKLGEPPVKKETLIDELALLLGCPPDRLESLEKVNKSVLTLLINNLK